MANMLRVADPHFTDLIHVAIFVYVSNLHSKQHKHWYFTGVPQCLEWQLDPGGQGGDSAGTHPEP